MLIISKHKDYYDSVVQDVGIDKTHVFNRKNEFYDIVIPKITKFNSSFHFYNEDSIISANVLVFCKKTYLYWTIKPKYETYKKIIWDKNEITEILFNNDKSVKYKFYAKILKEKIDYLYNKYDNTEMFVDLHFKYNIAYFSVDLRERKIETYPILKDLDFYKFVDPVTAFQEIDMFLFGVIGNPDKTMIQINEKDRQKQRGLDKTSFRQNAPGQKKEKRKLNKIKKRNDKKPNTKHNKT